MDSATGCCVRRVLSQQQDFREQKSQLQEEVEAANNLQSFALSSTASWSSSGAAEWYARENCEYSFNGLRQVVPAALESVLTASIKRYTYYGHCSRAIDAHSEGFKCIIKSFTSSARSTKSIARLQIRRSCVSCASRGVHYPQSLGSSEFG